MDKETFVKCINTIKENRQKERTFIKSLEILSPNTFVDCFLYSEYETLVVEILEKEFDTELISWWIYDDDFGNTEYHTPEELYDYLIKIRDEKNEITKKR